MEPNCGGVVNFVASVIWKSKWLIAGATIVAAAVAFAMAQASSVQIWSGRTTLTLGMVPSTNYLLLTAEPALELVEPARTTVAQTSDPGFRAEVLNQTAFEPATSALSRSLVSSSLRGIVLDGDRNIAIELSAASPADVETALRAFGMQIVKKHDAILNQRNQMLQERIERAKSRMTEIEKSSDQLADRLFAATDDKSKPRPVIFNLIPAWNELQDSIQRDTNLKQLTESSVLHLETGNYLQGPRSVAALRASLLAGLAMLLAMILLTVAINVRARPSVP
jgi:hypothetical protein